MSSLCRIPVIPNISSQGVSTFQKDSPHFLTRSQYISYQGVTTSPIKESPHLQSRSHHISDQEVNRSPFKESAHLQSNSHQIFREWVTNSNQAVTKFPTRESTLLLQSMSKHISKKWAIASQINESPYLISESPHLQPRSHPHLRSINNQI
jgi:hypothetical protein